MTDKQPTKEQVRKFWEKCGFKPQPNAWGDTYWLYPDKLRTTALPPIDLNNLFKYAVPKMINFHSMGHPFTVSLISGWGEWSGDYGCEITNPTNWKEGCHSSRYSLAFNQDPALALFWACYQAFGLEAG